jgi:outer membrane protein insertion porin family
LNDNTFELIFNIDAGSKFFFGDLKLNLPIDFDKKNFNSLNKIFNKTKGKPYSINAIDKILNEIDIITTLEQYKFIKANVIEILIKTL